MLITTKPGVTTTISNGRILRIRQKKRTQLNPGNFDENHTFKVDGIKNRYKKPDYFPICNDQSGFISISYGRDS